MNILQALKKLRDDLKAWVSNNIDELYIQIQENKKAIKNVPTFSGDYNDLVNAPNISEDDSDNVAITDSDGNVIFKVDAEGAHTTAIELNGKDVAAAIDNVEKLVGNKKVSQQIAEALDGYQSFSGDYNDLINAPIVEDETGDFVIADEGGNVILKVDAEGLHTTALTLNGLAAATEEYVDDAISNIPATDLSDYATETYVNEAIAAIEFPETDLTNYYTKTETDAALEELKTDISESIVAESEEWKVVDEAGNIIFQVDADGAHTTAMTLDGKAAATEEYVNEAIGNIEFPKTDLTNYATKQYVDDAVDSIEIPEADFTGYATETYVDNKVADLVNSAPEALDTLGELATALENHEDAYDALLETVGNKATQADLTTHTGNKDIHIAATERAQWHAKSDFSGDYNDLSNAPNITEDNSGNLVISDPNGNIIFRSDANGFETTNLTAQVITLNGADMEATLAEKQPVGDYALKSEIPSTDGLATEAYVDEAVAGIEIPEVAQSDWNQNDPSASDYILNRTHWIENGTVEILEPTNVVIDDSWGGRLLTDEAKYPIEAGRTYTVIVNGVSYSNVARTSADPDVIRLDDQTDNNPYSINYIDKYKQFTFMAGSVGSYTVSILCDGEVVRPLDAKFVPVSIARITDIPTKTSDLTNDSGFLTQHQSLVAYATKTYVDGRISDHNIADDAHQDIRNSIPTKVSDLTNDEGYVTETYVNTKVASLVDSAPETLNTLNELAAALGDDPNFATTVATKLGELETAVDNIEIPNSNIVNGSAARSLRTTSAYDNLGAYAFGEGLNTEASGMASHAAGSATVASGDFSYAGGNFTVADRQCMTAIGKSNLGTSGDLWSLETSSFNTMVSINKTYAASSVPPTFSPTEGTLTWPNSSTKPALNCSGSYIYYTATSYVFVQSATPNTTNTNTVQLTGIRYDIIDQRTRPGELLFVVGNGTSSNDRSNAHTLDWSGNGWFAGDVYVGSTSGTNRDEGSKILATQEYVQAQIQAAVQAALANVLTREQMEAYVEETILGGEW